MVCVYLHFKYFLFNFQLNSIKDFCIQFSIKTFCIQFSMICVCLYFLHLCSYELLPLYIYFRVVGLNFSKMIFFQVAKPRLTQDHLFRKKELVQPLGYFHFCAKLLPTLISISNPSSFHLLLTSLDINFQNKYYYYYYCFNFHPITFVFLDKIILSLFH